MELQSHEIELLQAAAVQQREEIVQLEAQLAAQEHRDLRALSTTAELTAALQCVNAGQSDAENLVFDGCNIHIRNGKGSTSSTNDLGNLILGYNEEGSKCISGNCRRSGSHNIVLGAFQSYTSYGGLVAGVSNQISAPFASILSGSFNKAQGQASAIVAGTLGTAKKPGAAVVAGYKNRAVGDNSAILGGKGNKVQSNNGIFPK